MPKEDRIKSLIKALPLIYLFLGISTLGSSLGLVGIKLGSDLTYTPRLAYYLILGIIFLTNSWLLKYKRSQDKSWISLSIVALTLFDLMEAYFAYINNNTVMTVVWLIIAIPISWAAYLVLFKWKENWSNRLPE